MSQSELINELAAALSKAQGEMQAAIKDKENTFFKSKYADLGSIWDVARPVLSKYGLCVMQTTELDASRNQVILVTTLAHTSGQWMKSHLPLNPNKNDSQGMGAAITYSRRFSLSAIVGVVCDEDDDGETAVGRGKANNKQSTLQENNPSNKERLGNAEVVALNNLTEKLDSNAKKSFMEWIEKNFNAKSISDIPITWFDECKRNLDRKIKFINDEKMAVA